MNRRCVAAILLAISVLAAGCAPSDAGQEADGSAPSPTVNANPDDGY